MNTSSKETFRAGSAAKIVFRWKSEDVIEGYLEDKLLVTLRIDDIPYEHCFGKDNNDVLHLYDGQETASLVSRDDLLEQLPEYFSKNSYDEINLRHLWDWIMIENFTAWFDLCDDYPSEEFLEEEE